jgi:signal recognition particle subunit SEC65
MGVRPDAPTIETIVSQTFYEIINLHDSGNPREPWKKYFPLPLA